MEDPLVDINRVYKFNELSKRAKNKAISDYQNGWLITHPDDTLEYDEVLETLLYDTKEDRYNRLGELLSEEELYL